jgi:hypothetical protein
MSTTFLAALLLVLAVGLAACSSPGSARTTPDPIAASDPGPLRAVAFLAGSRREHRPDGSMVEETWGPPAGSSMVGAFRWLRPDGSPMVFEILALTHEPTPDQPDRVMLRLRHYSAALVAKEAKDAPMTLALEHADASGAVFAAHAHCADVSRIVYRPLPGGAVSARVEFAAQTNRPALAFALSPVPAR